jgi:hypothetical protein
MHLYTLQRRRYEATTRAARNKQQNKDKASKRTRLSSGGGGGGGGGGGAKAQKQATLQLERKWRRRDGHEKGRGGVGCAPLSKAALRAYEQMDAAIAAIDGSAMRQSSASAAASTSPMKTVTFADDGGFGNDGYGIDLFSSTSPKQTLVRDERGRAHLKGRGWHQAHEANDGDYNDGYSGGGGGGGGFGGGGVLVPAASKAMADEGDARRARERLWNTLPPINGVDAAGGVGVGVGSSGPSNGGYNGGNGGGGAGGGGAIPATSVVAEYEARVRAHRRVRADEATMFQLLRTVNDVLSFPVSATHYRDGRDDAASGGERAAKAATEEHMLAQLLAIDASDVDTSASLL